MATLTSRQSSVAVSASESNPFSSYGKDHESQGGKVAFGTTENRIEHMFPLFAPPTRSGQANRIRGLDFEKAGPGRYEVEEKTSLLHRLENHVESQKGAFMSARTSDRFPEYKMRARLERKYPIPAPNAHLGHSAYAPKKAFMAFESSDPALPRFPRHRVGVLHTPGPGSYEHDVPRDRRAEYRHSFGGRKLLVRRDELAKEESPFERGSYAYYPDIQERYGQSYLDAFYKGWSNTVDPRLSILEGLENERLKYKEAYLSRYFDQPSVETSVMKRQHGRLQRKSPPSKAPSKYSTPAALKPSSAKD